MRRDGLLVKISFEVFPVLSPQPTFISPDNLIFKTITNYSDGQFFVRFDKRIVTSLPRERS